MSYTYNCAACLVGSNAPMADVRIYDPTLPKAQRKEIYYLCRTCINGVRRAATGKRET